MNLEHVDLYTIASDIWSAMLGLELKPNPVSEHHDPDELVVTAYVQITGDWAGVVMVQCSHGLARRAAGAMFGCGPDELNDEEVSDTAGELANMAGGNVKSLLAGSCQLSLPAVTTGRDYRVSIRGAVPLQRQIADCDGDLVVFTLLESS